MTTFRVIEMHDGRYIVVAIFDEHSATSRNGETLIPYEMDVRSIAACYTAISDYVVDSGMYLDDTIKVDHYRAESSAHVRNFVPKDVHVYVPSNRPEFRNADEMLLDLLEFDFPDIEERIGVHAATQSWSSIYVRDRNPNGRTFRVTVEQLDQ